MPQIDVAAVPDLTGSTYPEPYASQMGRRSFRALGAAAGLTQFGVSLVTMHPGDTSSLRHWHSHEDEFVWIVSGELVLVQDGGETMLRAGDAAGFKAGDTNGHHLINHSSADAQFLAVGPNDPNDVCTYSDVDLAFHAKSGLFTRHDGTPLED